MRVGRLAVLAGAAEHGPAGAEGDPSPLYSALSQACADSLPLARRLALRGLSCLTTGQEEEEEETLRLMVAGLDDHCSSVTLTALTGLVRLLAPSPPPSPPHITASLVSSLALKVRPYFESSSEDHRAAAIRVYSCLHTGGDNDLQYLDYISTVLLPVLLHSRSDHLATSQACLATLQTTARATKFKPLISSLAAYNPSDGFPALVRTIVSCR